MQQTTLRRGPRGQRTKQRPAETWDETGRENNEHIFGFVFRFVFFRGSFLGSFLGSFFRFVFRFVFQFVDWSRFDLVIVGEPCLHRRNLLASMEPSGASCPPRPPRVHVGDDHVGGPEFGIRWELPQDGPKAAPWFPLRCPPGSCPKPLKK